MFLSSGKSKGVGSLMVLIITIHTLSFHLKMKSEPASETLYTFLIYTMDCFQRKYILTSVPCLWSFRFACVVSWLMSSAPRYGLLDLSGICPPRQGCRFNFWDGADSVAPHDRVMLRVTVSRGDQQLQTKGRIGNLRISKALSLLVIKVSICTQKILHQGSNLEPSE
jgi:hypothetical protein